ncbi:MAG: hypothetical protein I4N51_21375 [Acinetobacter sp.]|uniref:Uncharacterized protein n=1 Tax=Acinetobacter proteolyticus TaxID=1776741 RepID=A0A2N0WJJ1_9GAMM|nr:hypothetical protein [Acinetobacter sp.]PKF36317.1 hypothetical protein CW311_03245 [Acinetobacter proteolyticus]
MEKTCNYLIVQIMKASKGKAHPTQMNELIN